MARSWRVLALDFPFAYRSPAQLTVANIIHLDVCRPISLPLVLVSLLQLRDTDSDLDAQYQLFGSASGGRLNGLLAGPLACSGSGLNEAAYRGLRRAAIGKQGASILF
jgi:hypothetical protein